ncbi:hypothetical protein GCM10019016_084710 [Streptomyces prasinosporus]|uniref:Uncharacterized protein n=1 Tax=Streptomyces prasinosporus TaxID=68256 RepID=A0ABP6U3Y2_9ACTN|nr:hypothetical protein GCM10010332_30710 [Streptomyces albogriseolus]
MFVNRPSIIERVSDIPSRLELLQFTRRVVEQQARASLRQLDRWIADEERREAERRQAEERRPPPPEWLIERGLDRSSLVAVHTGDCWGPGKRQMPATREQARDAIRQQVPACRSVGRTRGWACWSSPARGRPGRRLRVAGWSSLSTSPWPSWCRNCRPGRAGGMK